MAGASRRTWALHRCQIVRRRRRRRTKFFDAVGVLRRGWKTTPDFIAVTALSALEADKLSMRRRLQQEITELQQSKDEQVAELEREKETGVLQARILATEARCAREMMRGMACLTRSEQWHGTDLHSRFVMRHAERFEEALRARTARLVEEKAVGLVAVELQRQCRDELGRLLDEKAALAEGQAAELLKAQEAWQCAFVKELEECRKLQRAEAVRLQTLVQSMSERHQASEWQTSLLQAQHLQDRCQIGGASLKGSMEDLHPKRYEGDVTETEPEGEILPGQAFGKLKRSPKMWSPSFKDLNIQTDEEPF
ncbi:unnamed protein product [Durusdinium trenchii]|uniref:Uncharacterized protein n=1 Tax=Durusdinium trenchii TaxID=1381693 RepID=A0ABP0SM17_9DINO